MSTPIRQRQTELTREAILGAARRLFAEQGFARTSVKQLASEAGVAVRTVYLSFGSKQGVLTQLAFSIPDATRDQRANFFPEVTDPHRLVAAVAASWRAVYESAGDIIKMLVEGAGAEPELKTARELGLSISRASIQGFTARLGDLGALRPGLEVDEAAGHALVLASYDGYDELVHRRGWSHDRYEEWLRRALEGMLLPPQRKSRSGGRASPSSPIRGS